MTFRASVKKTPNLESAWWPGLKALRPEDRPHVRAEDTRRLRGSVYVDEALERLQPYANQNRWDFAIGYQHTDRAKETIYWLEIHTGSDSAVNLVLNKLRWLRSWLQGDGSALSRFERDFIWLSSGSTSFTLTAPQLKQFAVLGLQHEAPCSFLRPARRRDPATPWPRSRETTESTSGAPRQSTAARLGCP